MYRRLLTMLGPFLFVLVLGTASAPGRAIAPFLSESAFTAALGSDYYLENFNAFNGYGYLGVGPILFAGNGFNYGIAAPGGGLYKVPAGAGAISTLNDTDSLTVLSFTGKSVNAVGGFFFATDEPGSYTPGPVTVTTSTGDTVTLSPLGTSTFCGFISTPPFTWLTVTSPGGGRYPTLDHLYVGHVPVAPPAIPALLGMAAFGWWRRRKAS